MKQNQEQNNYNLIQFRSAAGENCNHQSQREQTNGQNPLILQATKNNAKQYIISRTQGNEVACYQQPLGRWLSLVLVRTSSDLTDSYSTMAIVTPVSGIYNYTILNIISWEHKRQTLCDKLTRKSALLRTSAVVTQNSSRLSLRTNGFVRSRSCTWPIRSQTRQPWRQRHKEYKVIAPAIAIVKL